MINIKIDKEESTVIEMVDFLNYVATQVKDGFTSGEGWELTGEGDEE